MTLNLFHPSVANWFAKQFTEPTPPQERAWPSIKNRKHTLIAAPTGSGKTFAAFLSAIDDLIRQGVEGTLEDVTHASHPSKTAFRACFSEVKLGPGDRFGRDSKV